MELPPNQSYPATSGDSSRSSSGSHRLSPVTTFFSDDTDWHHHIVAFLEEHPHSSLLAVVQHLWPDFLTYPTDRRARLWFRVKTQLFAMEKVGVLQCEKCDTDVPVWTLRSGAV